MSCWKVITIRPNCGFLGCLAVRSWEKSEINPHLRRFSRAVQPTRWTPSYLQHPQAVNATHLSQMSSPRTGQAAGCILYTNIVLYPTAVCLTDRAAQVPFTVGTFEGTWNLSCGKAF